MKTHKDLDVWKDSIELVVIIYQITKRVSEGGVVWVNKSDSTGCSIGSCKYQRRICTELHKRIH